MRKKQIFLLILLMATLFINNLKAEIVEISKTVRIEVVDGKTYEITERVLLDTDTNETKKEVTIIHIITE
ncbi:MAG: hypothetical protein CR982_01800 [Candidatus Cloacimonadota bacterium]|nr:MAG: hypothetical protein CR982_01800 [Candidatus Cloacimonadota bacterium]PIE80310.1 MAG: hypothetical protein CSA15_02000 [Candidatus Delongbacteria bacterium]